MPDQLNLLITQTANQGVDIISDNIQLIKVSVMRTAATAIIVNQYDF